MSEFNTAELRNCDKKPECPASWHWWDCARGRAKRRAEGDKFSDNPDAARDAEMMRALSTGDYDDPPPPPDWSEL